MYPTYILRTLMLLHVPACTVPYVCMYPYVQYMLPQHTTHRKKDGIIGRVCIVHKDMQLQLEYVYGQRQGYTYIHTYIHSQLGTDSKVVQWREKKKERESYLGFLFWRRGRIGMRVSGRFIRKKSGGGWLCVAFAVRLV